MPRDAKVRVVVYVSSTLAEQYAELSRAYGISRSELYRMAVQRGYRPIEAWCRRSRETFLADHERAIDASTASGSVPEPGPARSPLEQLEEFCRVLVDQDPDLGVEQVRSMAKAQAAVFGVPGAELDGVVGSVIGRLFPAEVGGAGIDEAGDAGPDLD